MEFGRRATETGVGVNYPQHTYTAVTFELFKILTHSQNFAPDV